MAAEGEDRQLIQILVHTLARIDEILRLTWEDVNFEQRWIRLWTRKRQDGTLESDELHMNRDLYQVLKSLWHKRTRGTFVFINPRTGIRYLRRPKLMRKLCRIAGIPHYGFHGLRRGVATLLQDKEKVGTKTVSGLLRHKRVSTTEQYLFVMPADQVAALKKLEGKFDANTGKRRVTNEGAHQGRS
jgi:integrase